MEIVRKRVLQLVEKIAEEARFIDTEQQAKAMTDDVRKWVMTVCNDISQDFATQASAYITEWSANINRGEIDQANEQVALLFQLLDSSRLTIDKLVRHVERLNEGSPEIYHPLEFLLKCIFADILGYMHAIRETIAPPVSSEVQTIQEKLDMIKLKRCKLWQIGLTGEDHIGFPQFDVLTTYVDESHLSRKLEKCRECGQLYFYEFYEEIDWVNGNDPQYQLYIPVALSEDAASLANMVRTEFLGFIPRLQSDWPADAKQAIVHWVGRSSQ